jgi:hypothetical protein
LAGADTGGRRRTVAGLAGSTGISNLFPLLELHRSDGFLPEDIEFIRTDFENFFGTDLCALAAAIALVCVKNDIPIT